MPVQNLEISNENLLNAVVNLPESQFERLIADAKRLRKKSSEGRRNRELRLIKKVNEATLSDNEYERFYELVEKRRDENISENELEELIALTEKSEELNVKRLKYLLEIAQIRNVSLREVMNELEIFPPQTI
jgi:G3E family GTPase